MPYNRNSTETLGNEAQRELARRHLADFIEYDGQGTWQRAKHLELLCDHLEAVERGEILRLMVFMPPRHGKSEVCSKKFPAWYLGRNPGKEIILSSYAADLAYDFSRIARDTLRERGELWNVNVASDSSAVGRWGIEGHRGGCVAAGAGGPITGRGAHCAIIDDPFKNAEEAASKTIRDKVWEWYRSTLRTRLAPGGAIVLIMTRWDEDDLAGRLIKEMEAGGEQWVIISMAAEAEEDDPLGRELGELLWPEYGFDAAWAETTKRAVGTYFWSALYQQRPSPVEGGMLKRGWWRFYRELPSSLDEIIQSWDMTFKDSAGTDFVVGQVWGRKGADKYLLDQVRDRMDFPATLTAVKGLTSKWPQATAKLVEDKANGPAVIAMLNQEIEGLIPVEPQGSKVARASAVSPQIEAGNVYLPDPSIVPWVHDFIEECAAFPTGAHDDQVDAMSQALMRLNKHREFYFF
ncbi:MAG TPA: phage terminase large subunit [Tepidimicrobium sp.]|nr:phage terminase large subunit [Tepidimicrobium sp.]